MFSKKDAEPARPAETPLTQGRRAMTRSSSAPSILSEDLRVDGSIEADGEIQLDGEVRGDVRAGALIIGEKALVEGEIVADSITVRGRVSGSLRGRQIMLASSARIEGDIIHSALSVEAGAFFEGHCRHSSDPMNQGAGASVSVTPARPAGAGDNGAAPTFGSSPIKSDGADD